MKKVLVAVWLLLAISNTAAFGEEDGPEKKLRLQLGFEHWYSDSFRSADQTRIFGLGMDYRLPIRWLQLTLRYEWAKIKADPTQEDYSEFEGRRISFYTIGPSLAKDFHSGFQTVTLAVMPLDLLVVKVGGHGASIGSAAGFTVDWLFDGKKGMFLDAREQVYKLDRLNGTRTDAQQDFNVVLGFVIRL